METRTYPRSRRPRRLWRRTVWPVLAGAVTAVGVLVAINVLGLVLLLVVYAVLSLFAVVTAWGLTLEFEMQPASVVRIGLYAALAVIVLVGLCQIHPLYGWLVALVVGLTSPAALGLLERVRRARRRPSRPATGVLVDTGMLNRRFEDIVSRLRESDDFPET